MTIAKKIYFILLIGLFVGLLVKEFIMDNQLQVTQYNRAKAEARELKNSIMAFRDYIALLNTQNSDKDELQKAHPLNTVIEAKFINGSKNNTRIKTASNKPILPQNLATEKELEDILFFDHNKMENERFSVFEENDMEYYHYSYALRLEQKCLACHSNYKIGDTRGIISILILKKSFDEDRILLSNNSYTVTFIVLMIIFVILYFVVIKPLSMNMQKFQNNLGQFFSYINDEDDEIDFQPIESTDELGLMSKEIHANILKAKKVIQSQKESHEKLQKLMGEEGQNKEDGKSKERILNDRSKSVTLLLNNISTNLHIPLTELKKHFQEMNKNDASIDYAVKEIECVENVLSQYRFFFEQEARKTQFKLQNIIQTCNTENYFQYKKQNIEIIDDYEGILLTTYEKELYQILLNILQININKLADSPYQERLILISATQNETEVSINIKDNAGGFNLQELEKLFDPLVTDNENLNIDPLRLYISKEIIRNHLKGELEIVNLDIDYKGKSFKGSEFILTLPNG